MKTAPRSRPKIVALIATRERRELLLQRALPSIFNQSHACTEIVIVEDGPAELDKSEILSLCSRHGAKISHLHNRRTPGASGAWNSGIDHIARHARGFRDVYVAFLDDDDYWTPDHLANGIEVALGGADIIASAFVRSSEDGGEVIIEPPHLLLEQEFKTGNPGIQASNLIVRLDRLLHAGMFDESLSSCTDRDIMIRLSRVSGIRYGTTSAATAHHDASRHRLRLSTPGSEARERGLSSFHAKYLHEMTKREISASTERAFRLFGWSPPEPTPHEREEIDTGPHISDEIHLVVGLISDGSRERSLKGLFEDLSRLSHGPGFKGMEVVVLENGDDSLNSAGLAASIAFAATHGLRVRLIETAMRDECFAEALGVEPGRKWAIAPSRTALQAYLYHIARNRADSVVWLLDDDMRIAPLVDLGDEIFRQELPLAWRLQQLREAGADIAICPYTGAPPLPTLSALRVQMVDLAATIRALAKESIQAVAPDFREHNRRLRQARRDYYYDLSHIETDRLETPFLFERESNGESCENMIDRLMDQLEGILSGRQLFRPLIARSSEINKFVIQEKGCHRGGNCFVFDLEALVDTDNSAPEVSGRPTRRSDMMWALIQRHTHGRRVVTACLPTYHTREDAIEDPEDAISALVDDIRGYAIYSAMSDVFTGASTDPAKRAMKYLEERIAALRLSFQRIHALAGEVRNLSSHPMLLRHSGKLLAVTDRISSTTDDETFERISSACRLLTPEIVREFISGILTPNRPSAAREVNQDRIQGHLRKARIESAKRCLVLGHPRLRQHAESITTPRMLGMGEEGVVFEEGDRVYKIFDGWGKTDAKSTIPRLDRLSHRPSAAAPLPPFELVHLAGTLWALSYPLKPTAPYSGQMGFALVQMLSSMWRAGIACSNFHPKNIRTLGDQLILVDIGRDILLIEDEADFISTFELMCRRAYLTFRCWNRKGLDDMMREARERTDLPGMTGYPVFWLAVQIAAGIAPIPEPELDAITQLAPRTILDFGCGKGKYARHLAQWGAEVVAYDPDRTLHQRLRAQLEPDARVAATLSDAAINDGHELVLCRRVLCQLDAESARDSLAEIRSLVSLQGSIVLSLCHPLHARSIRTTECDPITESNRCESPRTSWQKRHRNSNRVLTEFSHPERTINRWIRREGLEVVDRSEREAIDIDRMEIGLDLLVLILKPSEREPTTLLIKCCAMEAGRLRDCVIHLIEQLEKPHAFDEVVLSIDSKTGEFPRQYAHPDMDLLVRNAMSLVDDGWIDRLIQATPHEDEARRLNREWLGIDSASSHASNGAPLLSVFAALETITTRWVLQVDLDVIIGRTDFRHDYLADMQFAAKSNADTVTVSFNIAQRHSTPYTAGAPWRTEVRACLLDIDKMKSMRPLTPDMSTLPSWHRALDDAIKRTGAKSLRGGDHRTFFVHPENHHKRGDINNYFHAVDRIAGGHIANTQYGKVDLCTPPAAFKFDSRTERFVFVVTGRNIPFPRFRRCIDSILSQKGDWGSIFVDDASDPDLFSAYRSFLEPHSKHFTLIRNRERRGLLANTAEAIRLHLHNPETVVILLDGDDCLIGTSVLEILGQHYARGADLTVGTMHRSDKDADYPATFEHARHRRGGNVWQHLRTFKRSLFDRISDDMLKIDDEYVELASDWALMLPLTEIAAKPTWIRDVIYFHEPSTHRDDAYRSKREEVIARLVKKPGISPGFA